jgi:CcmD family protein
VGYLIASYLIVGIAFAGYAIHLHRRRRELRQRLGKPSDPS